MKSITSVLSLLLLSTAAFAATTPGAPAKPEPAAEPEIHVRPGPEKIVLGHGLTLDLPTKYGFIGLPDADRLLKRNGTLHNENLLGIVVGEDTGRWFITIRYNEEGFVKDDEKIDAADLLKNMREGEEEINKERAEQGFKALHLDGWSEAPHYDRAQHHLVWGLLLSEVGEPGQSLNYNTRILGRRGHVAINLVTDPSLLAQARPHAMTILKATTFDAGSRYTDFQKGSDKVAEYGLMGLILGGVGLGALKVAKVGLIAGAGKFLISILLALKKAVILLFLAIGAFFKRLFGKKDPPASPPSDGSAPPPPPADGAA